MLVLFLMPFLWGGFGYTLAALSFGIIGFLVFGVIKGDPFVSVRIILARGFGQTFALQVVLFFTVLAFLLLVLSPLMYLYMQAIAWNLSGSESLIEKITYLIEIFVKLLAFNLVIPLICASMNFLYFSLKEMTFAVELKQAIARITLKKSR